AVTLAENGSPAFELKVASVVSSFILTAVPVGREVCAPAKLAIRMSDVSENAFFMLPITSKFNFESLSKLSELPPMASGRPGYRRDRCSAPSRRCRCRDELRELPGARC